MESAGVGWHSDESVHWLRGELLRSKGDLGAAQDELEAALDVPASSLFPRARAIALYADILRLRGEPGKAVEHARQAITDAGAWLMDAVWARRSLVSALLDAGDAHEALAEADEAMRLLSSGEWTEEVVRMQALRARALDETGHHDEAAEAYQRARALLDEFPAGVDVQELGALLGG
ncbi:MAG: hypothetical protein NVSMB57_05130 [Actinomycetota bacterium]